MTTSSGADSSPSVPVESREQPRTMDGVLHQPSTEDAILFAIDMATADKRDGQYAKVNPDALIGALRELLALRAEVERLKAEQPPCDAGCRDYPEEDCSRHGRKVAEVWDALSTVQAERDGLREQVERARELLKPFEDRGWSGSYAVRDQARDVLAALAPPVPSPEVPEDAPSKQTTTEGEH